MERKGIISVGNWVVDSVKFIDVYPQKGNLTTIYKVENGLGGCSHNVLIDIARMESGIPLYAGGCVGNDDLGKLCLEAVEKYGVNGDNMRVLEGESTSYTDVMSEINGTASRTFFHNRGANAKLTPEMVMEADSPAKIFHLGYLLLLDELDKADEVYGVAAARALDALQRKGYKTSVDVVSEEGDRYRKVILPCLKYTDYFIINEVEAGACCDDDLRDADGKIIIEKVIATAKKLLDMGVSTLVVIHFPEGGVAASKDGEVVYVPSEMIGREDIVSPVGAGDAFCAGSLYAIHEDYKLEDLLVFANTCARFNLKSATSTGGAPTLKELNDYIESHKK